MAPKVIVFQLLVFSVLFCICKFSDGDVQKDCGTVAAEPCYPKMDLNLLFSNRMLMKAWVDFF
jgi:hypothetical protein